MRLTASTKRAAAGGLAVTAGATGFAWGDGADHALRMAAACLVAVLLVLAVLVYADREDRPHS